MDLCETESPGLQASVESMLVAFERLQMSLLLPQKFVDEPLASKSRNPGDNPAGNSLEQAHLKEAVRRHARLRLGVQDLRTPESWPQADMNAVADFEGDRTYFHPGLLMKSLRLDWDNPGLSLWTRAVANVFEVDFRLEYEIGSFPELSGVPDGGIVATIFLNYVKGLKRVHKLRQFHFEPALKEARRRSSRSRERRVKLWKRRLDRIKTHNLSAFAMEMITTLGIDGMSSDDSEGEIGSKHRLLRRKNLPWRSPGLTKWLHHIDLLPKDSATSARWQAGRPQRLIRLDDPRISVRCRIPVGLPSSFYDRNWISMAGSPVPYREDDDRRLEVLLAEIDRLV